MSAGRRGGDTSIGWKTYTQAERERAREERREEVDALYGRLSEGIAGLRQSDNYREYLTVMSRFHEYSFRNALLIMQQFPQATLVGSYSAWKRAGRNVRKGEKGIRILAPVTYPATKDMPVVDETTGLYERDAGGSVRTEPRQVRVAGFRPVSVFDVSQTDGRELPEIANELVGRVEGYESLLEAVTRAANVQVTTAQLPDGTFGLCDPNTGEITLREGMSEAQSLKTLLHEIAHRRMHPPGNQYSRAVREVQAESMAFVVSAHFGLDTSDYSFGYLDSWSRGVSDDELSDCVDIVSRHSAALISQVEHELEQIRGREAAPPAAER